MGRERSSGSTVGQTVRVTAISSTTTSGIVTGFVEVNLNQFSMSPRLRFPVPYKASQGSGVIHFTVWGRNPACIFTRPAGAACSISRWRSPPMIGISQILSGENVASGVYFYVIQSPEGKKDGKLIIIK